MRIKVMLLLVALAMLAVACGPTVTPTAAPTSAPTRPAAVATSAPAGPTAAPVAATPTTAAAARPKTRLSIATGPTGGVYYPYGGGLAALISKNVTNVDASAEATAASVDNMKLIQAGKADLTMVLADTAFDALEGRGMFKDFGKVPVRSLAVLYANYLHIVASEESGIKTIADLKGKRVSMGAAGSGTEIKGNRVLEAMGINPETDIKRERLTPQESASAMKDKKLDAFFWDGGLPTAAIIDLASSPGQKIRMISSSEAIAKMNDKYGPFYFKLTITKNTYAGMDADVDVAGTANLLAVNEKFDATLAYDILKMMVDKSADLGLIHSEAKKFGLPQSTVGSPIPFHPGAIKFYGEKGITVK